MFRSPTRSRLFPILAIGWVCAVSVAAAQDTEPVRLASEAFGVEVAIEVRDLPPRDARAAIRLALLEVFEVSQLLDPESSLPGSLGALNRGAGGPALAVDERTFALLLRGLQYCLWSHGAHGPLGGAVYHLWQLRDDQGLVFEPFDLRDAVATTACNQITLRDGDPPLVRLGEGTRLLAFGMQRGFAADRAVELLRSHGAGNLVVEIGNVVRAVGPGPSGEGWPVAIPGAAGSRHPLDSLWLRDQSLAVARMPDEGERRPVDLRTGVPARGVVQVAAVSQLAVDTEALAVTLYVLGLTEGQRQLGNLEPRPSVFWLLGNGTGVPLESTYRWSELEQIRR